MNFSNQLIWMNPLSFLRASGVFFHFYDIFDENRLSKQISPRWDLELVCLPMYHKKDAMILWVNLSSEEPICRRGSVSAIVFVNKFEYLAEVTYSSVCIPQ